MLDDLLTLLRRRRAPARVRKPVAAEGGWRIDRQTVTDPMFPRHAERIPHSGPRMQQAARSDQAQYAERQHAQQQHAERQRSEQLYAEQQYAEQQYAEQQHAAQHYDEEPYPGRQYAELQPTGHRSTDRQQRDPRANAHAGRQAAPHAAQQGYLAAHAIEKSFASRRVVKGASLYVRRGEAVGLLGPNGAGKTTIFYMITGLIQADRGRIELDGNDVTALPMYQRARLGIGYLPQEASIFRGLNVEDNIRSVLEVVEPDRKRRERDLEALLDEFGIGRLRKSPSIALSGGERRRVEIARALASRPNYMLLDEPFAGIDPIAVGDLQTLVRHLTNRGIGVLITDHNVRETLGLTDRAYIIYSGEVLMEGRPDEIVNNPDVRRLYLGEEFRL